MAKRPTIDIQFKQLATTLIERSQRGTAILLLNDSTLADGRLFELKYDGNVNTLNAEGEADTLYNGTPMIFQLGDSGIPQGVSSSFRHKAVLEASTMISFDVKNPGTAYIFIEKGSDNSAENTTIYVDGITQNAAGGIVTLSLSAGTHSITKGTADYLYYIAFKETGISGVVTNIYKTVADIDDSIYTADSLKYIKSCMSYAPYEVVVISGSNGSSVNFADYAPAILKARSTGWIAFAGVESVQADLASWIKSMELQNKTYKAVGTVANKDCKHYVYFNQTAYDNDGARVTAVNYLPNLLGIVASCNVLKGCTNFLCSDLSLVDEVTDIDSSVAAGQLVLTNDIGGVRIVTGINSLVTLNGNTATEDMQYIETVEVMDLIEDDIRTVFKTDYQGHYKNKYKYQLLFIGAVNQYFSQLAAEDILDDEFDNNAEIDVDAQRSAWVGTGKSEAADWDDDKVKKMSFKRSVFIASNIKALNCMENLKFTVTLA